MYTRYYASKKKFAIGYSTEYDAEQATLKQHDKFPNATFTLENSTVQRKAEEPYTIMIKDIPLYVKQEELEKIFNKFGEVTRFSLILRGAWQQGFVVYKKGTDLQRLHQDLWSLPIMDFRVRLYPLNLTEEEKDEREAYCLKLTGLPVGTTHLDMNDIIDKTKAKSCFIPKSRDTYRNLNYAFLTFISEEEAHEAYLMSFKLRNKILYWNHPEVANCTHCGNPDHRSDKCRNKKKPRTSPQLTHLYERFKPANYHTRPNKGTESRNWRQPNGTSQTSRRTFT